MISSPTSALNLMFKNCFFRFLRGSEQTLCCWRHRNYAIFIGELKMGCCWYPKVIGQYDLARCLHNCDFGDDEGTVDEIDEHSKMICYWRRLLPISLSPFTLAASVSTSFRRIDITLKTRHKSHHQWLIDLTVTTYPHSQLSEFFLLTNILSWANGDLLLPECLPPWKKITPL